MIPRFSPAAPPKLPRAAPRLGGRAAFLAPPGHERPTRRTKPGRARRLQSSCPTRNFALLAAPTGASAMRRILSALGALALLWGAGPARAGFIAYNVAARTAGNQDVGGEALGLDFDVNAAIVVTRLGVFDSGGDGLQSVLTAQLYDRDTRQAVTPLVTFALGDGPDSGTLIGGSRFLDVAPLTLQAGFHGSIVVSGYDGAEMNYNTFGGANPTQTTDSGGGLISFVGFGRYSGGDPNVFPTTVDSGPENRYDAGTFEFEAAAPAPGGLALAAAGAGCLAGYAWRRRHRPSRSRGPCR